MITKCLQKMAGGAGSGAVTSGEFASRFGQLGTFLLLLSLGLLHRELTQTDTLLPWIYHI